MIGPVRADLSAAARKTADAVRGIDFAGWLTWYRQVVADDPASAIVVAEGRWGVAPPGEQVESAEAFKAAQDSYRVQ